MHLNYVALVTDLMTPADECALWWDTRNRSGGANDDFKIWVRENFGVPVRGLVFADVAIQRGIAGSQGFPSVSSANPPGSCCLLYGVTV